MPAVPEHYGVVFGMLVLMTDIRASPMELVLRTTVNDRGFWFVRTQIPSMKVRWLVGLTEHA